MNTLYHRWNILAANITKQKTMKRLSPVVGGASVCSLPAKAVCQAGAVEPDCLVQLFPLGPLSSRMDTRVLAALTLALLRRSLERGGAEEQVGLTQEVAQALSLWRGLGVALTVLHLAHGMRSTGEMSWRLIQGVTRPSPNDNWERLHLTPATLSSETSSSR